MTDRTWFIFQKLVKNPHLFLSPEGLVLSLFRGWGNAYALNLVKILAATSDTGSPATSILKTALSECLGREPMTLAEGAAEIVKGDLFQGLIQKLAESVVVKRS